MRRLLTTLGGLTCLVLLPATVFAQGGTIAGVVKDTSGAVLPGVTVQVASPALIEKTRETVTDGTGQYRIVDLRPGTYSVTATLTGFNTFKRDGVEVSGIAVITINADMKVGAIEETVTVSGETPVVDLQSTTKERVMSKDVVDALPTGRIYTNLGVLVPGVNSSQRDVGGALGDSMGSLTAHGGSGNDQRILQNGLNVMTLQTGGGNIGGMVPNTSAAQEVAIDTSAASAERATGGVTVNFIPRDGGNTIRGSVFATGAFEGQQASNLTQDVINQGMSLRNNYKTNWDINPGVGGPIMQDKLWYYYTYRNNAAQNYAANMYFNQNQYLLPTSYSTYLYVPADGTNGAARRQALGNHANWWDSQLRLTWQANPKNKFAATWDQQWKCECARGIGNTNAANPTAPESGVEYRFPTQQLLHGEWWSPVTSKVLIEVVALHRTERWGNMHLRLASDGGSQVVSPATFANFPSLIGVTETNGNSQVPNGLQFHGPPGTFNNTWVPNYTYRWAVSYITGAHAFKVGGQDSFGFRETNNYLPTLDAFGRPVRYRMDNSGPNNDSPVFNQVTMFNTSWYAREDQNHELGLFVQDRWTMNRLTLSGGVRFDYFNSSVPAQNLVASTLGRPNASFAEITDTVNWKDVTPRLGAAYDLKGDGKTALKVSLNKYVAGQSLGGLPGNATTSGRLTNSASRTWNDANLDGIVNCNLTQVTANGECTNAISPVNAYQIAGGCAAGTAAVNCTVPSADLVDYAVRQGWNVRSYNWEFSLGVQHEILPRVSVDVSYFRRWFGNFTVTNNPAVVGAGPFAGQTIGPSLFDRIDIVTPIDARLPGGGGQLNTTYLDPKDVNVATAPAVPQVVLTDSIGANHIQHWNGVDVSVNARLQNGLLLQGGTSTGHQYINTCDENRLVPGSLTQTVGGAGGVSVPLSFCEITEPWLTQVKGIASYTLPRYAGLPNSVGQVLQNFQVSGTFQSIPGSFYQSSYTMPNSEFLNPAIATFYSDLAGTIPIANRAVTNAPNKAISLVKPGSFVDDRQNQLDMRVGKILRFGRTRTSVNLDVYNVTNASTVLGRNNSFSKTSGFNATTGVGSNNTTNTLWVPNSILQSRFYKVSATFDF